MTDEQAGPHAAAVTRVVGAMLGLPAQLVELFADLAETIANSADVEDALTRAKQNLLADAEDAASEAAADAILKAPHYSDKSK